MCAFGDIPWSEVIETKLYFNELVPAIFEFYL